MSVILEEQTCGGGCAYTKTRPWCTGLSVTRQTSTDYLQKLMSNYNLWLKWGSITMLLEGLFYVCLILWHFEGMKSGWLLTVVFPLSDWVNSWWQACSFHKLAVSHVDEQTNKQKSPTNTQWKPLGKQPFLVILSKLSKSLRGWREETLLPNLVKCCPAVAEHVFSSYY